MAVYSKDRIQASCWILSAVGIPYREPGNHKNLVIANQLWREERKFDASGFDIGSVRHAFNQRDEAESFLDSIRLNQISLNPFREIDPAQIQIREMLLDIRAIDFTDNEHADIGVLGALDFMKYWDKELITKVWPVLNDITIAEPRLPPQKTKDGNPSALADGCYALVTEDKRRLFHDYASEQFLRPDPANEDSQATDIFNNLYPGSLLRTSLKGVAEEIGKLRLGLNNDRDPEVLRFSFYDVHDTFVPRRSHTSQDLQLMAYRALASYDAAVEREVFEALQCRGINPRPVDIPSTKVALDGAKNE